jgi:hypothetical protein
MNQHTPVTTLDQALQRVAEFITSPVTREHIDREIGKGLIISYEVEVRHHQTKGLLVSVRYSKGHTGQVFYLGNIDGPKPEHPYHREP